MILLFMLLQNGFQMVQISLLVIIIVGYINHLKGFSVTFENKPAQIPARKSPFPSVQKVTKRNIRDIRIFK